MLTYSKRKQTRQRDAGEKITVSAVCSVPLCEMPWASKIARCFVLPLHSLTSTPAARSSRGQYILDGTLLRRGVRVSRVSIHPVREKRRFVFLHTFSLNLIIGKQASRPRFSPPSPFLSPPSAPPPIESVVPPCRVFLSHDRHPIRIRKHRN